MSITLLSLREIWVSDGSKNKYYGLLHCCTESLVKCIRVSEETAAFIFRVDYVDRTSYSQMLVTTYLAARCYIPEDTKCVRTNLKPNLFQIYCLATPLKHAEGNSNKPFPLSVEFSHFVEIAHKHVFGNEEITKQDGSRTCTVWNETEHATNSNNSSVSFH